LLEPLHNAQVESRDDFHEAVEVVELVERLSNLHQSANHNRPLLVVWHGHQLSMQDEQTQEAITTTALAAPATQPRRTRR
jgi:hypothetical protein